MRVVIADDHGIVRDGLRLMLSSEPDIEIVGEAGDGAELLDLLRADPVDVALVDVRMPGMSGLEALAEISEELPQVRVVILTMHDQASYVRRAIELGAAGYVLKNTGREELVRALNTIADGGTYFQGDVVAPLIAAPPGKHPGDPRLSPREREVLVLVADGYENKQIARELGISEATVKTYLRGIFDRLDAAGRAEAVATAIRLGLID